MNLAAATNENLAHTSNVLIYSSMAVYTLAFLAHIAEWVFGSRSKVGRTAAALTAQERAATGSAVKVQVTRAGGSTTVLERPQVITRSVVGTRDVPDGPGASGGTFQGDMWGRIAVAMTVLAFLVQAGGVVARALSVERAPWGNMYEFSITFSTVAVAAYLILLALRKNVRWMGLLLVTVVLLDLGIATTVLYTDSDQLVPALHSYWLWIHVSTAIICGAVFFLGAVATLLYLFRDSYEKKIEDGGTPGRFAQSVLDRLPSAATLDKFSYRANAAVFPLWTFTIIAGAICSTRPGAVTGAGTPRRPGRSSPGSPTPATCTPARPCGWKGRKAAYLALIAFGCWLFNYYGVNIFITGKHSYAGV